MGSGPRGDLTAGAALEQDLAVALISDANYLSRCAIALSTSSASDSSHVLGLGDEVERLTHHFPGIQVHSFQEFLSSDSSFSSLVANRSRAEQIFSLGPSFLLNLSQGVKEGGWLIYMDSDLYFFRPLRSYLGDLPSCNVVIAPHRHYFWNRSRLAKYGKYNVGLVAFKNNEEGLRALRFWADSCLEWCYDRAEDGKYADQKYLEQFTSVSTGVLVDSSLGANLAPWNSFLKRISLSQSGEILVRRDKLMYFHAQGLKQENGRWILGHLNYLSFAGPRLKKYVYRTYLEKLEEWAKKPGFEGFGSSRAPTTVMGRFAASVRFALSLLTGQTIKVLNRRSGA